ncbi:TetR/AcrR family transcriptional regulator [Bacillus sp. CGMCC 1.16607]|uniref:TetR/AcrR family transcriptional regulator n=1 Tax=Bacillus sp. CGMCC 1.16607 TaxID=3351842 RepID=UPI0036379773
MISTKEKIKKVALTHFATKGYAGTSMKNISDDLGLNKASLYSHFKGKEEILMAVYFDLVQNYVELNKTLFEEAKDLDVQNKLQHIFDGYIKFYYNHTEIQMFWSQMTLLSPLEIRGTILKDLTEKDQFFQMKMEEIFLSAMDEGIIRRDIPSKLVMSFRAMRDGLLSWMLVVPGINEESIGSFWNDYWLGLACREESK